jgi:predicted transcriptional regulator of viral defense system
MKDAYYFGQGRMMVHTVYPEDDRKKKGLLYRVLRGLYSICEFSHYRR